MQFPKLVSKNLLGEEFNMPEDFKGEINIVIFAFIEKHQDDVDTWIPFIKQLKENNPKIDYYELPTVGKSNFLFKWYLDNAMRQGIKEQDPLSRTITIYEDRKEVMSKLGESDLEKIYLFVLNKSGEVAGKIEGAFEKEKSDELKNIIDKIEI